MANIRPPTDRPPYDAPRDTTMIYSALVIIALLVVAALVWSSFGTGPTERSAQNQTRTEQPAAPPPVKPQ